jgi:hypothetical protein
MNKTHTFKKTAAILLALGLTFGATACDSFRTTDNMKDLKQVVANVNIYELLSKEGNEYKDYAAKINTLIEGKAISSEVSKRDLVASFLSRGYMYVQSYGYTYEQTFNLLMDNLTNTKILTQYATAYYLKKQPSDAKTLGDYKAEQLAAVKNEKEKALLNAYPEVLTMKYFLTNYGKTDEESMKPYFETVYALKKSLNSTIDSAETSFITADEEEHNHDDSRTLPTNANTEKTDYVPMLNGELNYDVYTGRNGVTECGKYEKQEGSTTTTRKKAYNSFLSNLRSYGLIKEGENVANATQLDYYYIELSSALGSALISKYYEDLQDDAIAGLTETAVTAKYNELLANQKDVYTTDYTKFETALDGVSKDAFLLHGLENYGFVYNILLPFTAEQQQTYTAVKNKVVSLEAQYQARKSLLADIEAKDLRGAWLSDHDHANYGYEVTATAETDYFGATAGEKAQLFFENNVKETEQYEKLTQYAGLYPYQGTWDGKKAKPNTGMKIDDFITEMEEYINFVVGEDITSSSKRADYDGRYTNAETDKVDDYSKFIYSVGKANFDFETKDYFNPESTGYKVLSAVNELMFAYSTDPGCLNTYMGYVVQAYKTNFVSEFEYASQYVVEQGVGSYAVVPSEYGWHIIYCSYKFDGGEVYGGYNHAEATGDNKVEGSFSNMFYESLKATSAANYANAVQSAVLNEYKSAVELFTKRYQDLLDLDKQ